MPKTGQETLTELVRREEEKLSRFPEVGTNTHICVVLKFFPAIFLFILPVPPVIKIDCHPAGL